MNPMVISTAKGLVIKIRNFEFPDIKRIMEIEEEASLDGNSALYMELYEEWPEGFLVVEKDDDVIAFEVIVLTPEGEGRIFAIAVDSRYRGLGIGRSLLRVAFSILRKNKIGFVQLEVRVSNQIAERLYRSMGYIEVGFAPYYYKDGEGAILMKKVL